MSAVSIEAVVENLRQWRRDKLALTLVMGLVGGESVTEAWVRLDDLIPTMRELSDRSRPRARNPLPIDHDIARRAYDIAREIEPWLRQLAEREAA